VSDMRRELGRHLAAAKASGDLDGLTDHIPFARMLGLGLELQDGQPIGRLRYRAENIGNTALPALHGGTIAALCESTAIFELLWRQEAQVLPKVVSITIEYLRSGKPVDAWAHARITRAGRRVANLCVAAWQDERERPIATATAMLLLGTA
jgi:acyl-coenzyme A thioesterase PaaI-like protein